MMTLFRLAILTLISTTSCTITVTYLRGVQRLSNQHFQDHYFSCNTLGLSLIWEVNGTVVSGFIHGKVAKVVSHTTSIYNYTATLLSSIPRNGGQFTLDSVLIVTLPRYFLLNVTCRNGTSLNSTFNGAIEKDVINKSSINSVFEEYVLTKVIVTNRFFNHTCTSIFICGVENAFMYWRTETNDEFRFRYSDSVGQPRGNLEYNESTVTRQAILIAREPYRIVSVLFVTDTSDVTVTCGYPQNEVQLTSRCQLPSPSVDQTDPQGSTRNTSSPSSQVDETTVLVEPNRGVAKVPIITGIVVPLVVLIAVGIAVGIVLMMKCFHQRNKHQRNISLVLHSSSQDPYGANGEIHQPPENAKAAAD